MGGKSSKCSKRNRYESHTTRYRDTPLSPYAQPSYNFPPPTPNQWHNAPANSQPQRPAGNKYSRIDDEYHSLDQVTRALARAGLESSNLIVGIDFTKSNEWTGRRSFRKKCLHHIGEVLNPYEQAISIIGKTLSKFDEDNLIPCFGFGDATTHDQDVFSFYPDYSFCDGFEDVLRRYRFLAPQLQLAGPTSFAPIIEMAITIVEQSGGQYHVLLIIADGQVTRSVDTSRGQLSPQEKKTIEAIVKASEYPLSIILVGVGDGPWDMMKEFDDNLPARAFANFQFVNFTKIMSKDMDRSCKEAEFALSALMEIPSQYKATLELNLLGSCIGKGVDKKIPLPPPQNGTPLSSFGTPDTLLFNDYHRYPSVPPSPNYRPSVPPSPYRRPSVPPSPYRRPIVPPSPLPHGGEQNRGMYQFDNYYAENHLCFICFIAPKDMAFGCGHQTCCECGKELQYCPICRSIIQTRIKLYN